MLPKQFLQKFNERAKGALLATAQTSATPPEAIDLLESIAKQKGSLGANLLMAHEINLVKIKKAPRDSLASKISKINSWPGEGLKSILKKATLIASNYNSRLIGTEHLLSAVIDQPEIRKILQTALPKGALIHLEEQLDIILKNSTRFPDVSPLLGEDIVSYIGAHKNNFSKKNEKVSPIKHSHRDHSRTQALDYFTSDLTAKAAADELDPMIGRKKELDRLIKILCRRTKNNPLLIGDPGVGKTAMAFGLAQKIASGDVPENLIERKLFSLDLGLLVAGTVFRGEFEARLKEVIEEAEAENAILFIDEIHTVVGAGSSQGSLDAANILKPAISTGKIQIIGATTSDEYRKYIERDPAFERRFQIITIAEPTEAESIEILRGLKKHYENFHSLVIADKALEKSVWYAKRFIHNRFLPDKAIDVLDEAAAEVRLTLKQQPSPKNLVKEKETALQLILNKKELAIKEENYEQALKWKISEERAVKDLELVKSFPEKRNNVSAVFERAVLNETAVKKAISQMTGIPLEQISALEKNKLQNLENNLKSKIIGQNSAITKLAYALKRSRAGLKEENRPLGSLLFLGPSGVGKTELAKMLAQIYFENPKALIKLDMSEFSEGHTVSKLIGAPAGYVGYEDGGQFIETVRQQPHSLVLFDEIEKAHPNIHNLLLQMLEDGELTSARGAKASFRNCLIIFTSNIGNQHFWKKQRLGFGQENNIEDLKENKKSVLKDLSSFLKPELISRLDEVVIFEPLKKIHLKKIASLELEKLRERLIKNNLATLKYVPKIADWLAEKSYSLKHGARKIRRNVRRLVENPLAHLIVSQDLDENYSITADIRQDKIQWKTQKV